jgi:hypothetical protein
VRHLPYVWRAVVGDIDEPPLERLSGETIPGRSFFDAREMLTWASAGALLGVNWTRVERASDHSHNRSYEKYPRSQSVPMALADRWLGDLAQGLLPE